MLADSQALLYNLLLLLLGGVSLRFTLRRRSLLPSVFLAVVAVVGALFLGHLNQNSFYALSLLSWGLFVHAPLQLAGLAWGLRRSYPGWARASLAGALLVSLVGVDAFLIEPQWLEITHLTLPARGLDRPLKVAVLADFQTDVITSYERSVLRSLMQERPDLIVMPGDYLQDYTPGRSALREGYRALFRELEVRAPLGVHAVQGNVETLPGSLEWTFEGLPVQIYPARKTVDLGPIILTALTLEDSFDTTLRVPPTEKFQLVLGHGPDFALGQVQADLMIAGHTHGGQVRLPFIGPLVTLSKVPRSWAAGLTHLEGGRVLVVSRGTGMERGSAPRLRFLCRPELIFIDLVPEKGTSGAQPHRMTVNESAPG